MLLFWFLQHHHKAGLVEKLESEQICICYYGLGNIITQLDAFFMGKFFWAVLFGKLKYIH